MNQFYLTLPSNSSMGLYPNNTAAKFTTLLPRRITLHGRWEVGVVEIHFPQTFYNVRYGENEIQIYSKNGNKTVLNIPPNYYRTKEQLYAAVNKAFSATAHGASMGVGALVENGSGTMKFLHTMEPDVNEIKFSNALAIQLGYEPDVNLLSGPNSEREIDLDGGFPYLLYCYCDIIEDQSVGDTTAPLLRIVNTQINDFKYGRGCTKIFTSPIYLPVQKREFNTIEIDIRDGKGDPIPFVHGSSAVLLDFRRVKES